MLVQRSLATELADALDPPSLRYRYDPVAWATERAHIELWSKQREILCSIRDNPNTAVQSCHSAGKSFTAALVTAWWLDVHPAGEARVVTTAPTSKQVDAVLWYEIGRLHRRLGLPGQCNLREWYINKQLVALGRKPADNDQAAFQGMHARFLLAIYDEAYGIPNNIWDEGSSLASNEFGRQLAIGNPDGAGRFKEVCKEDDNWHTIRISYRDTPNFTGEDVSTSLKQMLIAKRWVDERRTSWGPDSALFQAKCEGEFPTGSDPYSVVQHDWAMLCKSLDLPAGDVREGGIDVGGGGDRTVLRMREGMKATQELIFVDRDPMRSVGKLARAIDDWGLTSVKIDSTGLGWGVAGRLRELSKKHNPRSTSTTHNAEVTAVNFGAMPFESLQKKFLNVRAVLWWQIGRELTRQGLWDLGEVDDDTIMELTSPKYEILDSYGKIKIEPKKDIIKRLGFSPDRAEALLLAFYTAKRPAKAAGWSMYGAASGNSGGGSNDHIMNRGNDTTLTLMGD